jgi:hypothetical protein
MPRGTLSSTRIVFSARSPGTRIENFTESLGAARSGVTCTWASADEDKVAKNNAATEMIAAQLRKLRKIIA